MGLSYNPKIVTSGLTAYLDAANAKSYPGSGTTWTDMSRLQNSFTGTFPTYSSNNKGYFTFDGTDDYVSVQDPEFYYDSVSAFVWFYPKLASTYHVALQHGNDDGSNTMDWALGYDYDQVHVRVNTSTPAVNTYTGGTGVLLNKWGHAGFTYDGARVQIYINGALSATTSAVFAAKAYNNYLNVGRGITGGTANLDIAIATVYNRALTPSEVTQNFNAHRGRFSL